MSPIASIRIIGPGRAGTSFDTALRRRAVQVELLSREDPVARAGHGVDAVLICTPDSEIASVAAAIEPSDAAVLHCSGATTLAPVSCHERAGSVHPLMALPNGATGAERLLSGGWFAVAGDEIAQQLVHILGGRSFAVSDDRRALYHATAAVSANHLVALLGQVERLADAAGVPVTAFLDLAAGSFDDARRMGAGAALTGPAARGDQDTLDGHRAALESHGLEPELWLYDALARAAATLAQVPHADSPVTGSPVTDSPVTDSPVCE